MTFSARASFLRIGEMCYRPTLLVVAIVSAVALAPALRAQQTTDVAKLTAQVVSLYRAGKYGEAIPITKMVVAIREKALGPSHPNVAYSLNNLAELHRLDGQFGQAESLYKRTISIVEDAFGKDHLNVASALNNLATLYTQLGRLAEAEPLLKRALSIIRTRAKEEPVSGQTNVGASLEELVTMYKRQGQYEQAEPLLRRMITILEKALASDHPFVATALNKLAELLRTQGRYAEAEPLYKRSLAIDEAALGPNHPSVAPTLNNLALLYGDQARYAEAAPLCKRSLAIMEKALGPDHPKVGLVLSNLAELYRRQGRYAEAEPLFRRSLAITKKALGPDHPQSNAMLNNLALLYEDQARYAEAEPLYKRSLAIMEKALGPDHPDVGGVLSNLAEMYRGQERHAEAEPLFRRSLAITKKALGPDHPQLSTMLNNLALLYEDQARYAEAEPLYKRSLAITEKALGPDHPYVYALLGNLARSAFEQRDWAQAAKRFKGATAILQRRAKRELGASVAGSLNGETRKHKYAFKGLLKATRRLAAAKGGNADRLAAEAFETAQWSQSSDAAASLAQMAARSAMRSAPLAALVRERQDLVAEWQATDKQWVASRAEPPARRIAQREKALADRLFIVDRRLAEIDAQLSKEFPDYAALARPWPISVAEVQAQLLKDEALVLFLDTDDRFEPLPGATFVWIITQSEVRWVRSEYGTETLRREVAALRCGLDATAWHGDGAERCAELLKLPLDEIPQPGDSLPFDTARAHALYDSLLGQAEYLIEGKHLLVVPSGALTKLPLQVLVTALPDGVSAGLRVRDVARLGVEFRDPVANERVPLGLSNGEGAFVIEAVPGGPAAVAGVQTGDIILSIAGKRLERGRNLAATVQGEASGSRVAIELLRDGKPLSLSATLGTATLTDWVPHYLVAGQEPSVRWLARENAITVLPSVAALGSLRRVAKPSQADRPLIGFGNPLLDGPDERYAGLAGLARASQKCQRTRLERMASVFALRSVAQPLIARGGIAPVSIRGGLADLAHLKAQVPLPETADELCAVARDLGAEVQQIRLGAGATEAAIKRLNRSGKLSRYRIVHFATHGTLAGQLSGTTEPGLILTPPTTATAEDDGYLSASEIASLKLDADWVILSACNTAGPADDPNAEALSGLARVFFYAGARALLVSHWEVYSDAAVKLITSAVRAMARDETVGRAEALRRAMLDLIDNGTAVEVHPAYWAPFVVVGEGAAG